MSRTITFDMRDLTDYDDITAGSHLMKLKAKAENYRDSDFSVEKPYFKIAINYFCIENYDEYSSCSVSLSNSTDFPNLEYSYDLHTWTTLTSSTSISLAPKQKVYLRGNNAQFNKESTDTYHTFSSTGSTRIKLSGDIATLYDETGQNKNISAVSQNGFFKRLFKGWTNLYTVSELVLSATSIAERCYEEMFMDCSSLADTPTIVVETAQMYSMRYMFMNCSNLRTLTNNPIGSLGEIPAYCCYLMFASCVELTQLPKFNATTYGDSACERMFRDCSKIYIYTTQSTVYPNAFRIPANGTGTFGSSAIYGIIENTGGLTYSIVKETTYYSANVIVE